MAASFLLVQEHMERDLSVLAALKLHGASGLTYASIVVSAAYALRVLVLLYTTDRPSPDFAEICQIVVSVNDISNVAGLLAIGFTVNADSPHAP